MDLTVKYRPTTFAEIIGQKPIIESLQEIIQKSNSLPAAILFSGPSGIGKTTIARVSAKAVGCIAQNILELDAATHSSVDDARELTELASYTPLGTSNKRVFIIDECHRLSRQAIDALLKNIEEPSDGTSWILCSTDPGKIPSTIKTRCHHYELQKVDSISIFNYLNRVNQSEGLAVEKRIINYIAIKSNGSPRQALVGLSMVRGCASLDQAKDLIKSISEVTEKPAILAFCKELSRATTWQTIKEYLQHLESEDTETVRLSVLAYFTRAALRSQTPDKFLLILEHFSRGPYNANERLAPVVLATAKCIL